ncbi:MAG: DUF6175 family protein [Bacteroidales bacterium]
MQKIILLLSSCFLFTALVFGQAKKPTLMVVPSDVWSVQNGYTATFDNQGTKQVIPDYKKALQNDANLLLVISKINSLMAERGFPLKNMETVLKSIEQSTAEDNLTMSKTSGAELAESPLERFKRVAKADIILQLTWTVNTSGPKSYVTYNLQGLDPYTNKQIAGAQGSGAPSITADIPVLLEEAVLANMDNFTAQLQNHFDDLFANGREVVVNIRVFNNGSGLDLEKEYGDKELGEVIDEWMYNNTVNHRYSKSDASENYIYFEQVRIPLYKSNGMAMDTESFVRDLRSYLRKEPYKIESKVMTKGLGGASLILGEK